MLWDAMRTPTVNGQVNPSPQNMWGSVRNALKLQEDELLTLEQLFVQKTAAPTLRRTSAWVGWLLWARVLGSGSTQPPPSSLDTNLQPQALLQRASSSRVAWSRSFSCPAPTTCPSC